MTKFGSPTSDRVTAGRILPFFVLLCAIFGFSAVAHAQTPVPAIWSMSYGNYDYGWTSQNTDTNGNAALHYVTWDNLGSATLIWNPNTNTFVSAAFNPPNGGSVMYTTAGTGHPPGALLMTGSGTNALASIGAAYYSSSNNLALPGPANDGFFQAFVYASENYSATQSWQDMLNNSHYHFQGDHNGSADAQVSFNGDTRLEIASPYSGSAVYTKSALFSYSFSGGSGGNALSSINGYAVTASGSTATIASPSHTITYGDEIFTLSDFNWGFGDSPNNYYYTGSKGNTAGSQWNGATFNIIEIVLTQSQTYIEYNDGALFGGQPGTFYYQSDDYPNANLLTAIGSTQYVVAGGFVVPAPAQPTAPPINNFEYGGQYYSQSGNSSFSNGLAVYQYHSTDGGVATVSVDPSTKAVTSWTISPHGGGSATYAPGSVAGTYVLQSGTNADGSNATNTLNRVNSLLYTINGNTSTAPANASDQGNLIVQGNMFSLGLWTNNLSRAGMSMYYQDGGASAETDISTVSSRAITDWTWGHASADGQNTVLSMELDPTHRLQLYAPDATPGAGGLLPSVVLDPSTTGTSSFSGAVRMGGPVRISKQGDLEMGEFTVEPTPAPQ